MAVICAMCATEMVLRRSRFGLFYGCPRCSATHGAHPDGRPMGIPGDPETKRWRMRAHAAFDGWRKSRGVKRGDAYRQLAKMLHLTEEEAHIARFNSEQCKRVVELFGTEGK